MTKAPERIVEMQASDFISEVIEQLQKLSAEIKIGPDGEGQDFQNTLEACTDDLEVALEKVATAASLLAPPEDEG